MSSFSRSKNRKALLRVLANIFGNLAAAWFGLILIVPRPELFLDPANVLTLTRSLIMGIVSLWLAYTFERQSL